MSMFSALLPEHDAARVALRAPWLSWTIAFAAALSAALVGTEVWQMWHVREATLRNAKLATASLAESIALQAENTLKTADTVVASIGLRVEADGLAPPALERLYGLMTSLAQALPAIHEMGITDKNGNALVKSLVRNPAGMNYKERDYFRFLSTHATRDVFVGEPVRSKVDGSLNITISRRIDDRDGTFAGVVVSSVSMDFFRRMFATVEAKSGAAIALVADNGMVLARNQRDFGDGEYAALSRAAGALEYASPAGHVRRVGSFSRLANYPMLVLVSQNSDAVLANWRSQVRIHLVVVACILCAIAFLGYRLDQATRATRIQALRDTLTGLANRRCLDAAMETEFRRAVRTGQPLSYVMADIDWFKDFNDTYGHQAGDDCLVSVGAAVRGVLRRAGDMAARYGGEEIGILLPETDLAGAIKIADDIREAIAALRIPHEMSPNGYVTVSAGIASRAAGGAARPATWQSLLQAADKALYNAKHSGRNTIKIDPQSAPAA